MEYLKDAHYFQLPSQGNIYTFTALKQANGKNKIFVGTLKREVFCFDYQETNLGSLKPTLKEIPFTYIPSGAEIIALDVFNKSSTKNDFVIGVAIIKNNHESNTQECFLNIYSEWEETTELNLESMAQNCYNIELNFVPYQLSHTILMSVEENGCLPKETVIMLTGGDNQVHMFREYKSTHAYKEVDLKEYFPEFFNPPSVVMWLDIYYYQNNEERLTVFGCECGYLRVAKVCVRSKQILFNFSTRFINSVTCVRIYPEKKPCRKPDLLKDISSGSQQSSVDLILNVVCVNSLLPAVFFRDVLKYGLKKYDTLRRLDSTSVTSCCEVADIDFDGYKEILLGSSAEEIRVYKFDPKNGFHFEEERKVVSPVLGMKYIDITGDGVKELIVFTLKGVYIFQHDHKYIEKLLRDKIDNLTIKKICC